MTNIVPFPSPSSHERLLKSLVQEALRGIPSHIRHRASSKLPTMLPSAVVIEDRRFVSAELGRICRIQLRFSEDDPPRLNTTSSCWNSLYGAGACEHLARLLMEIEEDLGQGVWSPAVRTMVRMLSPPTPERLLERLDQVLSRYQPWTPAGTPAGASDRWIAWRLNAVGNQLVVNPVLRSYLKTGRPGRGRVLSSGVIHELREHGRTEQDAAVRSFFEEAAQNNFGIFMPYAGGSPAPIKSLTLLAGHPDVEWEDGHPLRIEKASAGLCVTETDDQCAIALALDGKAVTDTTYTIFNEEGLVGIWLNQGRVVVGTWSRRAYEAAQDVVKLQLRVPSALGAALIQKLAPLRKTLPLTVPESLADRQVPPDGRIILVCEPMEPAGATVRAAVRPLEGGVLYSPGEGDEELSGFVGDDRVTTRRALEVEREQARTVLNTLQLQTSARAPWMAELINDEDVLDLVTRLKEPAWAELQVEWPASRFQVVTQSIRAMRVNIEAKEDWFGVSGETEIDGSVILLADLIAAAKQGRRYVALGHGKFAPLESAFRERLARMGDVVREGRRGLELSSLAAPLAEEVFEGVELVVPLAWKKLIKRVEEARNTDPVLPKNLRATLRDYQHEGYRWLWRLAKMGVGGCLADDMGLGKTVQAIAMLLERAPQGPQLVVAPMSVAFNWRQELARFAPSLRVVDFRTVDRDQAVLNAGPGDVVVCSYGLVRYGLESLEKITWTTLILDEAQAFKNYQTDTAKAVRKLKADWKLALTGTPLENHLGELYSLFHTVCPGLLGTWEQFASAFARPIEREKSQPRRDALSRLLRPFILRRTKDQVLKELPARTEVRLDAALSKQERTLYEATRLAALSMMENRDEKSDPRFVILSSLTRLRQIASHARMVDPSGPKVSAKQAVLLEQLDEVLSEGHTALVFSQFTSQLHLLEEEMASRGIKTLLLEGSTSAKERQKRVEAFQRGEAPVFLVSLKAGGSGLNLTAADYVFLMDPWWNPAVEDQAADRAHRIGQTRPVTIVRIVATGTVEEKVLSLHAKKRKLVASVLDGADVAARLSTDEMIDLLREGQSETKETDTKKRRSK